MHVPTLRDAHDYLRCVRARVRHLCRLSGYGYHAFCCARRAVPAEDIARRRALLETERYKVWFPPPPGRASSVLGGIVLQRLGQRVLVLPPPPRVCGLFGGWRRARTRCSRAGAHERGHATRATPQCFDRARFAQQARDALTRARAQRTLQCSLGSKGVPESLAG